MGGGPVSNGIPENHTTLLLAVLAAVFVLAAPVHAQAQRGGRGGAAQTPHQIAPIELTGYWVSVITEDWKWLMVTPKKGVTMRMALNAQGTRIAETWDPAKDEAAGEQCRSYGAANIMRVPGRLHITWQDANTLRIDTDAGTQTRIFHFDAVAPSGEPTWQGHSAAKWEIAAGGRGGGQRGGSLKVVTTNMRPGYVRKNGAPYK